MTRATGLGTLAVLLAGALFSQTLDSVRTNFQQRLPNIVYHGGPVMLGPTHIYYIYYGNWSTDPTAAAILETFASNLSLSPYFTINTTYFDSGAHPISNKLSFGGSATDSYSQGLTLGEAAIVKIVTAAITQGTLPKDTDGLYFVLTSPDVKEASGFCGYHDHATILGADIKFSWVGNVSGQYLGSCAAQIDKSPNNNVAADAMVNVISHELMEAVTDPDISAWFDTAGFEVADKCEWTFGPTYTTGNGALANVKIGALDYLIQQSWVNAAGGYCAMSLTMPVITALNPDNGTVGSTVSVTLGGVNLNGETINPIPGIAISSVSSAAEQLIATFTIAPGASIGARSVSLSGPSGASSPVTFNVLPPAPSLTSINPNTGIQGGTVPVTIFGANLAGGSLSVGGGIGIRGVTSTATQITATLIIPETGTVGPVSVSVSTPGGFSNFLLFTVTPPAASLTSINPSSGSQGTSLPVTIYGSNLSGVALAAIPGITVSNVVTTPNQVNAVFNIAPNAPAGPVNVSVNSGGSSSNTIPFTITLPRPTLTSISPASGTPGSSVSVTLTGTNLSGASVTAGGSIAVVGVTSSATQVNATFVIPAGGPTGAVSVSAITSAGSSNAVSFSISSGAAPPTLTSLNPGSLAQGASTNVVIGGTNFTSGAIVRPADSNGGALTVSNVAVLNSNQIAAIFTVANGASRRLLFTVITSGGQTDPLIFDVLAANPGPSLTGIVPNNAAVGTAVSVTLSGSNLAGASIGAIAGVTVSSVVASASQVSAVFTIAGNAAAGPRAVTITTPSGNSNSVAFAVTAAASLNPSLISITPQNALPGSSIGVILTGSNLGGGSINAIPGITFSNVVASASQVTATFATAGNAAAGARSVTVTTANGTSNALAFTVGGAAPVLASITPDNGRVGSDLAVTLTGNNLTGASINPIPGITIGNVVTSLGQVSATFSIDPGAAIVAVNVTVTTLGGTSNPLAFTINPLRDRR